MNNQQVKNIIECTKDLTAENFKNATPEQIDALLRAPAILEVYSRKLTEVVTGLESILPKQDTKA